jgi:hypothetical protein
LSSVHKRQTRESTYMDRLIDGQHQKDAFLLSHQPKE